MAIEGQRRGNQGGSGARNEREKNEVEETGVRTSKRGEKEGLKRGHSSPRKAIKEMTGEKMRKF